MSKDYFPSLSKKRSWRDSDPMQRLLKDWYGKEAGANEMIPHLPATEPLKDGIDKAMKKLVNSELALLRQLKNEWHVIAGAQLAKETCPSSFYKGILYVEVSHPAWLMQLGKNEKNMLLEKVHEFSKSTICRNIKFVPPGKRQFTLA